VTQHSGYLSVGRNMNMFFWLFEARKDPDNAPLIAWFNGGPGCSSMIGLFQVLLAPQAFGEVLTLTNLGTWPLYLQQWRTVSQSFPESA